MYRISQRWCWIALVLSACGCVSGERTWQATMVPFLESVQTRDLDRLYCLLAGAADSVELGGDEAARRAGFEAWAEGHYDAYEQGRDRGFVELDEHGLVLVKLFALGRGSFQSFVATRGRERDLLVVESEVRFGYRHLDLSRFTPGTTLYLCGAPAGRVHPLRIPARPREVSLEVLDTIRLEWTLVRSAAVGGCPAGWTVASVSAVPGSEVATETAWVF